MKSTTIKLSLMVDDLMNIQFNILLFSLHSLKLTSRNRNRGQSANLENVSKFQISDLATASQHGGRRKYRIRHFHFQVTFGIVRTEVIQ